MGSKVIKTGKLGKVQGKGPRGTFDEKLQEGTSQRWSNDSFSQFSKMLTKAFTYFLFLCFPAFRKYIGAFGNWHVYAFAHFGYQIQAISILSSIFMTVVRIVQNKWIKCADSNRHKITTSFQVLALERYLAITKPIEYHNAIQERKETMEFETRQQIFHQN